MHRLASFDTITDTSEAFLKMLLMHILKAQVPALLRFLPQVFYCRDVLALQVCILTMHAYMHIIHARLQDSM